MADDRVTITPYRDGPLLVRGPFTLVDQDGHEIEAGREVVALCRCGKSRIKPLCDCDAQGRRVPAAPRGARSSAQRRRRRRSELTPASHALEQVARPAPPRRATSARAPNRTSAPARGPGARGRRPGRRRRCSRARRRRATCSSKKSVAAVVEPEPAQAARVAPVRDRRRHLEQREVADERAAQAAVQAEQRHQVDGRERDAGQPVEVRAVGGVEPERRHGLRRTAPRACGRRGRRRTRRPGSRPAPPSARPVRRGIAQECGSASLSW